MKNIINKVIKKINIKLIVIITIFVIIICCSYIIIKNKEKNNFKINNSDMQSEYGKVCVYISGAIKNKGVYKFDKNILLKQAIDVAGGITEKADISKIDLNKVLLDLEKIVIPEIIDENIEPNLEEKIVKEGLININKADKDTLMTLDGIGEITANKIIEYRKNSEFEDIEDLKNVSGIGDSKYNKIKDNICIE